MSVLAISTRVGAGPRRVILGGAAVLAGLAMATSAAWACTIHVGTLTVCNFGTTNCYDSDGGQTGDGVTISHFGGTKIKVKGVGLRSEPYQIFFLPPKKEELGVLCSTDGVKVGAPARGPKFSVGRTVPAFELGTAGQARVCVREADGGSTGNGVQVAVI